MEKKNIFGGLLALFLLLSLASVTAAPSFPHSVYGKVFVLDHIMPLEKVKLSVCDYRLSTLDDCVIKSDSFIDLTDANGYYIFELANLYPGWRAGDLIQVIVCTGHIACTQVLELGDTATELNFDIDSQVIYIDNDGDVIDVDTGEPVDVPDNTIIVKPMTDAEREALALEIAGVVINGLDLEQTEGFRWWHGILTIICLALSGGMGYLGWKSIRGEKMLNTIMQKLKDGKYKK